MIVSISRRTDIPAFYGEWFVNRLRAGYCLVANPFNPSVISHVSLEPRDVDVFVFWSKNPRPFFPHLDELDRLGYRYYFLYTLNNYPPMLEPNLPPLAERLDTFKRLSARLGPDRVIWRYDPVILSRTLDARYHLETFERITRELEGMTFRVIVSLLTFYRKTERRLVSIEQTTAESFYRNFQEAPGFAELLAGMARIAHKAGLRIQSCADDRLDAYGIERGKCIDDELIREIFGIEVVHIKDPGQRPACGCVLSRDIGAPDTCLHGCVYCYSTNCRNVRQSRVNEPGDEMLTRAQPPLGHNRGLQITCPPDETEESTEGTEQRRQ